MKPVALVLAVPLAAAFAAPATAEEFRYLKGANGGRWGEAPGYGQFRCSACKDGRTEFIYGHEGALIRKPQDRAKH